MIRLLVERFQEIDIKFEISVLIWLYLSALSVGMGML